MRFAGNVLKILNRLCRGSLGEITPQISRKMFRADLGLENSEEKCACGVK